MGVWWAGEYSYTTTYPRDIIKVDFVSTLWETRVKINGYQLSKEETHSIDDTCSKGDLSDEQTTRCDKIVAVRTFIFIELFACLVSVVCPVMWLCVEGVRMEDNCSRARQMLRKSLLISAASCNVFASLWALLATIIGWSLDFGDLGDDISIQGGGVGSIILSVVLCLVPSSALEVLAWRWAYCCPVEIAAEAQTVHLPRVAELPNLVTGRMPAERSASKPPIVGTFLGREMSEVDAEAA